MISAKARGKQRRGVGGVVVGCCPLRTVAEKNESGHHRGLSFSHQRGLSCRYKRMVSPLFPCQRQLRWAHAVPVTCCVPLHSRSYPFFLRSFVVGVSAQGVTPTPWLSLNAVAPARLHGFTRLKYCTDSGATTVLLQWLDFTRTGFGKCS